MPSLCADLEDIAPGLWAEFCSHEGDESQPWRAKIDGQIPCLDRDWRKIIFRFFDYVLTNKSFLDSSYRPDGKRLESIVHPFRLYYGQVLTYPKLARTRGADSLANIRSSTCCPANFSETWPWSSFNLASALSHDAGLEIESRAVLDKLNDDQGRRSLSDWITFRRCLERADVHDLGRTVFSSMNSYPRKDLLKHDGLQRILSMIQNLIDHKVGNCDVLRKIIFDIVDECHVLPDCLKVLNIKWDPVSGDKRVNTRGGYADIYNGIYNDQRVALKMLRNFSDFDMDDDLLVLFKEAIVWRQLNHDNILRFYGICETLFPNMRTMMLISPWMELGDLAEFCRFEKERVFKGVDFMLQIAQGLDYLHSQDPQIIHGDLRGSNILVEKKDDGSYGLRLTDFGITEVTRIATKVTQETTKGALRWMAPEIIDPPEDSRGTLNTKSDTYSFAMTCVEIFAGKIPFEEIHRAPAVLRQVLNGGRPDKARGDPLAKKRGLDDFTWSLITRCWDSDYVQRPRMFDVVKEIEDSNDMEFSKEIVQEMKSRGLLSSIPDPDMVTEYEDVIEMTYNKARMMAIMEGNSRNTPAAAERSTLDEHIPHQQSDDTTGLPQPHELLESKPTPEIQSSSLRSPSPTGGLMRPGDSVSVPPVPSAKTTQTPSSSKPPVSTLEAGREAPRFRKPSHAKGNQPQQSLATWLRQKNLSNKPVAESSGSSGDGEGRGDNSSQSVIQGATNDGSRSVETLAEYRLRVMSQAATPTGPSQWLESSTKRSESL